MSGIREFSTAEGHVPATRTIDNDAPAGFRQELVDVVFRIGAQTAGRIADEHLFRISCQSLGIRAAGNPYSGFRHALGRDIADVSWPRIYDLICRLWPEYERVGYHLVYRDAVNRLLSAHGIAWDLDQEGLLRRVLPPAVQQQMADALLELQHPRFAGARSIFALAIEAYDDRPRRDRDACANSFDALEAVAKVVFNMPTATCGDILKIARAHAAFNPQVQTMLESQNTNRNRNYGHGVPFSLSPAEVDFTYLTNIASLLLIARRP